MTRKKNFYENYLELLTRKVTSFCVTRFRNSRIPNLGGRRPNCFDFLGDVVYVTN